ncbi:MAG: lipoate protein ligase C-terminal domain-containing protein [Candidatus Micrarchaeaceae archaeon]
MSNLYGTKCGSIRVYAEVENGTIIRIRLTGDFFMVPEGAITFLEKHLVGVEMNREMLQAALNVFYMMGVETPMLEKEDIVNAILGASNADAAY